MDSIQWALQASNPTEPHTKWEREKAANAFHKSWTRFKTICLHHRFCHCHCFGVRMFWSLILQSTQRYNLYAVHTHIHIANSYFFHSLFFLSTGRTFSSLSVSALFSFYHSMIVFVRIIYLCLVWLPFRMYFVDNVCEYTSCTNSISTSAHSSVQPLPLS